MVILKILLFILCLSVLIIVHELGHFSLAKAFGVYVEEFSLGFGPKIFSKKRKNGETTFSLRCLPLGGYVATPDSYDDLSDEEKQKLPCGKERTLSGIAKWKKVLVLLGGVTINFIVSLFILSTFYMVTPTKVDLSPTVYVAESSIAYDAGLRQDMTISHFKISGYSDATEFEVETDVEKSSDVFALTNQLVKDYPATLPSDYANLEFAIKDVEEKITCQTSPYIENDEILGWKAIGIGYNKIRAGFFESIGLGFRTFGEATAETFKALGRIITFQPSAAKEVTGPVGIYQAGDYLLTVGGTSYYYYLWGVVSLSLGLMNLLPIPGLDGWQTIVTVIEAIRRKDFKAKTKNIISMVGIAFLVLVGVAVLIKDIVFLFI